MESSIDAGSCPRARCRSPGTRAGASRAAGQRRRWRPGAARWSARASCARCGRVRRSCGDPAGRAGGDRSLRRHSCGPLYAAPVRIPPGIGGIAGHGGGDALPCPRAQVESRCRARARDRRAGAGRHRGGRHPLRPRRGAAGRRARRSTRSWPPGRAATIAARRRSPAIRRPPPRRWRPTAAASTAPACRPPRRTSPRTAIRHARPCGLSWNVPGIGTWSYRTRVALERPTAHWKVVWAPTVVHPRLTAGRRLGTVRDPDARAPILDRQGRPLVTARQVVRVGLDRATVKDVDASAAALAGVARTSTPTPSRAPPSARAQAVRRGGDAARLRLPVRAGAAGRGDPGRAGGAGHRSSWRRARRSPARCWAPSARPRPSRSSARRARSAPATTSASSASRRATRTSWPARRRAGSSSARAPARPSRRCSAAPAARGASCARRSTAPVQAAAEAALGATAKKAALVAVQPSTGDVLAVANRPTDAAYDRAIDGRYAAGLDVQGRHHRGAPARRPEDDRHRRLPEDHHRRGQGVQELRGRGGRRRALRAATSRSRATPPSSRSPSAWRPTRSRAPRATSASGAPSASQVPRRPRRRSSARRR